MNGLALSLTVMVELGEATLARLEAMVERLAGLGVSGSVLLGQQPGNPGPLPEAVPPAETRATEDAPPVDPTGLPGVVEITGIMPAEIAPRGVPLPAVAGLATSRPALASPWTPARKALLAELWPARTPRAEIAERLAALPGSPAPAKGAIDAYARYIGLRRLDAAEPALPAAPSVETAEPTVAPAPDEPAASDLTAPAPIAVPSLPPVRPLTTSAPPPGERGPERVTYETAFAWAGQRGLAHVRTGMDLDRVNAKRAELGLPAFELIGRAA